MRFLGASLLYLAAVPPITASAADVTNPLHKSKEEHLSAIQSIHASYLEKGGPPQRNAFVERKKKRRNLPQVLSEKVKGDLLKGVLGSDGRNQKGVKAKLGRFLFNQKKDKFLKKMTTRSNAKENEDARSHHRSGSMLSHFPMGMKRSSPVDAHVKQYANDDGEEGDDHESEHGDDVWNGDDMWTVDDYNWNDDNYYYTPPSLFEILDQISMLVTSVNQTEYTEVVEGITSLMGEVATIPSPEDFCADFDVTTTEDECVAAVSSVVTLLEGAIEAPWLFRDIAGYLEALVTEVVSWETVEGIVGGLMSMYGADGTIDGGLDAIRAFMSDLFQLAAALDPSLNEYYSGTGDVGAFFFDALPQSVATEVLAYDYNMLDEFGDNLYETVYSLIEPISYMLGEGFIEMPEGPAFHVDVCEAFGLVPANITAVISCDYFEDIEHSDIVADSVEFCVKPDQDMEDYSAELFSMESTIDSTTMEEMGFEWLLEDLQYMNYKFDNYDFMALESMTCSIKGKLIRPIVCNEKPLNTFLYKNGREKTCKWLRNRKHTDLICETFETAKYACPSTCCMCEEDPMELFFRRYIEEDGVEVPEMKSCKWLSFKTPENLEKLCKKNFAPDGLKVASGACPVTCGFCNGKDECQDSIDSFIENTYRFSHEDWSKYDYVDGYFDYGLFQYVPQYDTFCGCHYYYTGNKTTLGYFYSREGNTFLYGGGSQCEEEDTRISSKVIVEATHDLGKNGTTYFSQTSPCTYELKVVTFCNSTNTTNHTSPWSSRNLFQHAIEYLYPQPEDEVLDWQK